MMIMGKNNKKMGSNDPDANKEEGELSDGNHQDSPDSLF